MNDQLLSSVVEELTPVLSRRAFGKVFQLGRASLAVDFRTGDGRYLFFSVEPHNPRLYMVARAVRELEKQSGTPSLFALLLRKHLAGATLDSLTKDAHDRVVRFGFEARDEAGTTHARTLVAQLTGRSSNLFLLDAENRIVDAMRPSRGVAQEVGERYEPPRAADKGSEEAGAHSTDEATPARPRPPRASPSPAQTPDSKLPPHARGAYASLSEALDNFYRRADEARAFDSRAAAHSSRLRQSVEKLLKLRRNLERDLDARGDADEHKRAGDLLLANLSTAVRSGTRVSLTDYFAEDAPAVEFEVEENRSLPEEAVRRFSLYTKAKRAAQEISQRLEKIAGEIETLEARRAELQTIIEARDAAALESFATKISARDKRRADSGTRAGSLKPGGAPSAKTVEGAAIPGVRRYRSSDGYEILVGRGAGDNDRLTFRVARSQDLWLHAADYPGSHVVVRNQKRGVDVPHRTVIEAAQLAAHFSQARKDSKVAVNYTPRKFVSKIKGGAPGLVRLSSFRTLLVEPGEAVERLM